MVRIFTRVIPVVQGDIDVQGHVNNLRYLAWMQDVATAHSAAVGWPLSRYVAEKSGWVVKSHTITYRRPAFLGETIVAATWIAGFSPRMSPRKYLFWRPADQAVLAEAMTEWVYVSLDTGRPIMVPQELRDAFTIIEDEGEALEALKALAV